MCVSDREGRGGRAAAEARRSPSGTGGRERKGRDSAVELMSRRPKWSTLTYSRLHVILWGSYTLPSHIAIALITRHITISVSCAVELSLGWPAAAGNSTGHAIEPLPTR